MARSAIVHTHSSHTATLDKDAQTYKTGGCEVTIPAELRVVHAYNGRFERHASSLSQSQSQSVRGAALAATALRDGETAGLI